MHGFSLTAIDFSPDSSMIVSGSPDGKVAVITLPNANSKNYTVISIAWIMFFSILAAILARACHILMTMKYDRQILV